MKTFRTMTIVLLMGIALAGNAQTMYDALRLSRQQYNGTARSLGMGNAFTALGGDMGALPINPAASAVYRYSEFAVTPALDNSINHAEYLGNSSKDIYTRFNLSNLGWIGSFKTGRKSGLVNFSFGIALNRTADYTGKVSASGTEAHTSWLASMAANMPKDVWGYDLDMPSDNPDAPFYKSGVPWRNILAWNTMMLDTLGGPSNFLGATENVAATPSGDIYYLGGPLEQRYYNRTYGSTDDITFNFGGNVSDKVYFGINLTFQNIWYHFYESYSETAKDPMNFETRFQQFEHNYSQSTTGFGINLKAGVIYRPVKGLRLGAAISTPTWKYLTDSWSETMYSTANSRDYSAESPLGTYNYRITSPFRWNLGVAYTFGKIGLVSVDYENTNYSAIRMADSNGDRHEFQNDNAEIGRTFRSVHNIRAGLEFKPIPVMALRAGYNYYDRTEKYFNDRMHFISAGLGYAGRSGFFADLGFQHQLNSISESYSLYSEYEGIEDVGVPVLDTRYLKWKILLTLGFKF